MDNPRFPVHHRNQSPPTADHSLWIQTPEKGYFTLEILDNYTPVTLPFRRYNRIPIGTIVDHDSWGMNIFAYIDHSGQSLQARSWIKPGLPGVSKKRARPRSSASRLVPMVMVAKPVSPPSQRQRPSEIPRSDPCLR